PDPPLLAQQNGSEKPFVLCEIFPLPDGDPLGDKAALADAVAQAERRLLQNGAVANCGHIRSGFVRGDYFDETLVEQTIRDFAVIESNKLTDAPSDRIAANLATGIV